MRSLPTTPVRFQCTNAASLLAVAALVDVGLLPRMSSPACSSQHASKPTPSVLFVGDGLEVCWSIASRDAAQVVEMKTWRDRSIGVLVSDAVDDSHGSTVVDFTVSATRRPSLPKPASIGFEGSRPDAIYEASSELLLNRHIAFDVALETMANVVGIAHAFGMFLTRAVGNLTQLHSGVSVTNGKAGV